WVVGKMNEVAGHQPRGFVVVRGTGFVIQLLHLAQSAERHGRGERSDDNAASETSRQLDRWWRKGCNVCRDRPLDRLWRDRDILELEVFAFVRNRFIRRPELPHDDHRLFEDRLIVLERYLERPIFPPVVATAGREIHTAAAEQIQSRPL